MRLVKLAANRPSFRTVVFNRSGLSFVLAEQRSAKSSRTKTYNGVGKSLMLELLHFCLGANVNKAFQQHLKGWIFFLTVEIDGHEHIITRRAHKAKELLLDHDKINLGSLRMLLE